MAAPYELTDDSVVVIIGSGAGGGTLGNELAQKGIDVVILEAGPRHEYDSFVNDEWASFSQLSWLDNRTTSGDWRVSRDFPNLPAWIVKAVGGTTTHWAGASLRIQEHEFKALTNYGRGRRCKPARLANQLCRSRALLYQGRRQDGRDRHQRSGPASRQQ
jgi:choline dehydrogenase-like flavoprotein